MFNRVNRTKYRTVQQSTAPPIIELAFKYYRIHEDIFHSVSANWGKWLDDRCPLTSKKTSLHSRHGNYYI